VTSASDTLAVTGIGTIFDLNVMLDIPHAYTSDMEITLTSPSTTSVLIVDSAGGSNDDVLVDIILSDGSPALSTAVAGGQGFGLFAPSNPLSAFNSQSADGTWSLDVVDTFTGSDDGCLQAWALLFNSVTFVDPGQTACGGGGTATLSFSPTSPGSFTIGGADLNVTLTGTPTGGAFTLGTTSTAVTGGSFSLTGSTLTYSGGTSAGTATAEVTYTVTGFTPATATYSVTVTGGGGGGTPGQFSSTPGLDVVSSASDTLAVTGIGTIFDLDVMLDIPHAYTSDMEITLTSPSTTSVLIVDSIGSSNDDVLVDIILSDGSPALSTAVAGGQGFGLFAPSNPLSAFNSQSADGTWSLDVVDTFTGSDDGCLQAWALLFNSVTFVDPGQTPCGGGGTATLSFSPTSPGSFTIGGADLNVTLTGTPTGGAFTLGTTSTAVTGGSFSLTGSTLTYSGGTSAGTATAEVTYTVTGFTPATATYSVTVTGGGGGGTPGQFSSTPGLDVVTSASDTLAVTVLLEPFLI
jgi:subtilisin-like proprotein convertase family protein